MSSRGGRIAAYCTITGLLGLGLVAPAAHATEGQEGAEQATDAVAVLALSDDEGAPTDLTAAVADLGGDVSVSTQRLGVPEFYVAAVTWDGQAEPADDISIRVENDGEWTPWADLEPDTAEGDVSGTEPYVVGGATGVQVRVGGDDGALPQNLQLHLIPAEPADEEVVATTQQDVAELPEATAAVDSQTFGVSAAAPARAAVGAPRVINRAGWGADESKMTWTPRNYELRASVVHHTAGTNSYTAAQSPSIVRGIYHYHAITRDWGDIGYNFLVDKYGQIFEGRAGSVAAPDGLMPQGAHASGFNSHTLGISVLGDYSTLRAPDSVLRTMADVIAWKFDAGGVDMSTPSGMISPGTSARPSGQNLPRIYAHRDVGDTTCPGNNIYARIPVLNERVAAMVDGDEYHLKNNLSGGPADLAFRLGLSTDDVLVGDWDGDGKDTLALRRGNTYYVYNAHPGYGHRVIRYGRANDTVLVGDWNGDGKDTFAVRRGQAYHVKNSMTGGDADAVIYYGRTGDEVLVGDWNADGVDTLAVRRGSVYHVKNRIAGGDADRVFPYGRSNDVVLVGDWNRDGSDTFAVRRGRDYHVRNSLTGGDADVVLTYGRADDVVLVGDWNGNGRDTFGVRRSS